MNCAVMAVHHLAEACMVVQRRLDQARVGDRSSSLQHHHRYRRGHGKVSLRLGAAFGRRERRCPRAAS